MTQKTTQNPWTMDVRVRERNLKSGALTEKELEKQLAALPDLADHVEPFATLQPALTHPPTAAVALEPAFADDEDEEDDEDDDDELDAQANPEPSLANDVAPAVVSDANTNGEGSL